MAISIDGQDREYDKFTGTSRHDTGIKVYSPNLATKIVISGTDIYVGKASVGSLTSSGVWQIKKIDTASDIIITWASSNDYFDKVMDNAIGGYTYG